jgi:predicted P-loop ATPase/GTPase
MEYRFISLQKKCIVVTEQKTIELDEEIIVPTKIGGYNKPSDYEFRHKTREFSVFSGFYIYDSFHEKYCKVIDDLFMIIDLVELLKAFNGNKLDANKDYYEIVDFENTILCKAEVVSKDGKISLRVWFEKLKESFYIDKFECSSLAAKLTKILQKCEAWQE